LPEQVDERAVASRLYAPDSPDPDLLIRTAGELRVSNYLLWQISYAELYVTDVLWPDFGAAELHTAIRDFARRTRRFGGLTDADLSIIEKNEPKQGGGGEASGGANA
jgi:undecaprenyl diphosphate synthase